MVTMYSRTLRCVHKTAVWAEGENKRLKVHKVVALRRNVEGLINV